MMNFMLGVLIRVGVLKAKPNLAYVFMRTICINLLSILVNKPVSLLNECVKSFIKFSYFLCFRSSLLSHMHCQWSDNGIISMTKSIQAM